MNWIPVTQNEARSMFSEAIGVFGLRAHSAAITRIVTEETVDINHQTLIAYSKRVLASSLNDNFTITLGYCCYVLPFERYKKLASRYPDDNLDVGEAFGLHIFNNAAALKARYPGTIVYTWKMDPNPKRTWFADVLRNSFAHGQSKIIMVDELGVEISNARDGITPNFAIFMTLPEFRDLIVTALTTFITTVVQGGTYEPLSKLLQLNV